MATDTANNQHRRIDDRLPGQSLRWDDAQGGDNEEPLDPQLQRIVDAFMPEADNDPDPELRAGGPKRLIAFDYFKRGYLAREQSSTVGAARQGGVTSLEGLTNKLHNEIMNLPCKRTDETFLNEASRLLYKEGHRDARHAAAELVIGACIPPSTAPAPQTDEILALHRQLAAEKLRADQGWERAEAKSKECIELRERMAAPAPQHSELSDEWIKDLHDSMFPRVPFDRDKIMANVVSFARAIEREVLAKAAQAAPSSPTDETEMADRLRRIVTNHGDGTIPVQSKLLRQAADECDRFYNGMMNWKANAQAKDLAIIELRASKAAPSAKAEPVADVVAGLKRALKNVTREYIRTRAKMDGLKLDADLSEYENIMCVEEARKAMAKADLVAPAPAVQAEDVCNQALEALQMVADELNECSFSQHLVREAGRDVWRYLGNGEQVKQRVLEVLALRTPSTSQTSEQQGGD